MIIVLSITLLAFVIGLFALRIVMAPYWARGCAGRAWREAFPDASKQDIRDFLQAFVDGFGFESKHRLRFLPSDVVMDIYNRVRGPWWDDMELETFADELEDRFDLDLDACWDERITLGRIFSEALMRRRAA